jgi:Protein of unknown function (DUF3108)
MRSRIWISTFLVIVLPAVLINFKTSARAASFSEGERLVYDISWLGMNVGTGTLEVKSKESYEDRKVFRIVSKARSNKFISLFYPVEDRIESLVDADGVFPYSLQVQQRHGPRRVSKQILFDQEEHRATMTYKGKTQIYSIPPQVQDSLSCLYFLRTLRTLQDLPIGQSVFMDVYESKKNWHVEVQVLSHERVEVPIGTFDTIKVKAKIQYGGVLMDKGDITLWVTDDERRIPIQMEGRIMIGSITASLASANLPNPPFNLTSSK